MPKLSQEKIDKRKRLYLKHKKMLDDFYKYFKGSFVQKQGREIVIKLGYTYNSIDKNNEIIKKLYTANVYNKAIAELENLGLIKTRRYGKTNNKSISYTKPLLCLIFNTDNQASFASPTFSNTTNRIFDTNLFKGYFILSQTELFNINNKNTMFKNNQELYDLYRGIYDKHLEINNLQSDKNSNEKLNMSNFYDKCTQIKNLKKNPQPIQKNNYDIMKKYNKFRYYDLEVLQKKDIYLWFYQYRKGTKTIRVNFNIFCFENLTIEKLVQNIGDTVQTAYDMFSADKFEITIMLYFLDESYQMALVNKYWNEKFYWEEKHKRVIYKDYINIQLNPYNINTIDIRFLNTNIINNYREGNRERNLKEINDKRNKDKLDSLEIKES